MSRQGRSWRDHEDGFIQDHEGWAIAQIAAELGRSTRSVRTRRRQLRTGKTPDSRAEWSKSEDDFLIANPRMSERDAATHLGRTFRAVKIRRHRLKALGMTIEEFGGNWSPFVAGARPVLAMTCPRCGLLLQAKWFHSTSGYRHRNCYRCNYRDAKPRNRTARGAEQTRECAERFQALSLPGASRRGQAWTDADLIVLHDPDMTVLQKALVLHRTYKATKSACHKNGFKSKYGLGDPERDQWIIDNPNAGNVEAIAASLAPLNPLAPTEAKQPSAPQWDWDESDLKVSA